MGVTSLAISVHAAPSISDLTRLVQRAVAPTSMTRAVPGTRPGAAFRCLGRGVRELIVLHTRCQSCATSPIKAGAIRHARSASYLRVSQSDLIFLLGRPLLGVPVSALVRLFLGQSRSLDHAQFSPVKVAVSCVISHGLVSRVGPRLVLLGFSPSFTFGSDSSTYIRDRVSPIVVLLSPHRSTVAPVLCSGPLW